MVKSIYTIRMKKLFEVRFWCAYTLCPKKTIPDNIDCNSKKDYQILIIFGVNIPDTTGHQMTIQVPTSPNMCF